MSTRASSAPVKSPGKLRIAMISCGAISDVHFATLKKFDDVELVAAVDRDEWRLRWAQEKYGVPELFTDWNEMLAKVNPDAVDICAPNGLHAAIAVDALNAGAHVMTEKPMARTSEECERMIDAARRNDRKLAVGFQYRFHANTRFLARARDEGEFGKVMFVKCQALRRRGIPNWGLFGRKEMQGGGPLIDLGIHILEAAHYLMGSPRPVAASGNIWTYFGNKPCATACAWPNWDHATYDVEDLAVGQIRFDNGAVLQVETSFVAHIEKDVWNITLMGEKGGCTWDPPSVFTDRAGHMTNYTPSFIQESPFEKLFELKLRNWVDGLLYDKPLEAPGEAGLAIQRMIDAIYASAAAGREVQIG